MQKSCPPVLRPQEASSDPKRAALTGPIFAAVLGLLLTLEIFQTPLFSLLTGTDVTRSPNVLHQVNMVAFLANLAICVFAAARLVLSAPDPETPLERSRLGRGETACLVLSCLVGGALVSSAATVWWAQVRFSGWGLTITDELVKHLPRLVSNSSFHALLAVAWLVWYSAEYGRRGKLKAASQARRAALGVVLAMGFWYQSGEHLEAPVPLVLGLTAMLYATGQAARMQLPTGVEALDNSDCPLPPCLD